MASRCMTRACCVRPISTCGPSRSPAVSSQAAGRGSVTRGLGGAIARIDHSRGGRVARANGGFRRCGRTAPQPTMRRMRNALTEDERRVLDLLAVGLPMHDVAQLLRISDVVLQKRVAHLLRYYAADDRMSMVATAYRRGDAPGLRRLARSVALARVPDRPG